MFKINKNDYIEILKKIDNFLKEDNLDFYYRDSILEFDILGESDTTIKDYFFFCYSGCFYEKNQKLEDQFSYENCDYEYFTELNVLEIILTIFLNSSYNKENREVFIEEILNELDQLNLIIKKDSYGNINILNNKILDSGSYSNVLYYSKDILLKQLKNKYRNTSFEKRFRYEYENMKKLDKSKNILKVFDFLDDSLGYTMEQADCCLYDYLMKNDISLNEKIKIIEDVLSGIKMAHDNSIIHRDLHLGNILKIKEKFVISDFGLGKDLTKDRSLKSSNTQKNDSKFVDPEYRGDKFTKLDKISDIYSVGVIISEILKNDRKEFEYFLSRCTSYYRKDRYDKIEIVISNFNSIVENLKKEMLVENIKKKIEDSKVDQSVVSYLMKMIEEEEIIDVVLKYNKTFEKILLKCDVKLRHQILVCIMERMETSYNGLEFSNYSDIGKMVFRLFDKDSDKLIRKKIKEILCFCDEIVGRYDCRDLYKAIKNK